MGNKPVKFYTRNYVHMCMLHWMERERERRKEKEGLGTEEFRSICTYAKGLDIGGRIRIRIKRKMI